MEAEEREAVEARLGHRFADPALLAVALTHASGKSEACPSNERLEFLGDSVVGLVVSRHLYDAFPASTEGDLTKVRSAVVSARALARACERLDIVPHLTVGKGLQNQPVPPPSLLADVYEALVAAIFLDGGIEAARAFVLRTLAEEIVAAEAVAAGRDWKSALQQHCQRIFGVAPTYRLVAAEGPDHGKRFDVVAIVGDREWGRGSGRSKKDAEQEAAGATLEGLLRETTSAGAGPEEPAGCVFPPTELPPFMD